MKLKRNEEIINHPCQNWTDEDGVKWSRPTLAFLQAQGFTEYVAPVVPPTPIPIEQQRDTMSCTARQCRLILSTYNLLATVEGTVASMGGTALIEWEYAGMVERLNPLVDQVALASGMSAEQIDQMFQEAILL